MGNVNSISRAKFFNPTVATVVYVVISLATVVVLTVLLVRCQNKKEHFCTCTSAGTTPYGKRCPDPRELQYLYNTNQMTEYTPQVSTGEWPDVMNPFTQFQQYPPNEKTICGSS
jgi:hypothetical protein